MNRRSFLRSVGRSVLAATAAMYFKPAPTPKVVEVVPDASLWTFWDEAPPELGELYDEGIKSHWIQMKNGSTIRMQAYQSPTIHSSWFQERL